MDADLQHRLIRGMTMSMLLALTLTVTASAPPLPPEEAVRVLRASRSIADRAV